jgi:hypothetical protein
MPKARIVTRFPERARSLRKTLLDSGYHVEVLSPEDALRGTADLEYDLDEMPEYAGQPDTQAEREFIFAPQWRALKARFGKTDAPAIEAPVSKPPRVVKKIEPSVSYARLEEGLDEKFVDQPANGPSLLERLRSMRGPLAEKLNSARQDFEQKRRQLAQHRAERRAKAEAARRVREAELAAKREADRVAAERARAEEALRLQEQKARDAQRVAEVQAQMEIRRQEQELSRAEAEQRARLEAERQRAAAIAREAEPTLEVAAPIADTAVERRLSLREIFGTAFQDLRDWRGTLSSTHFANTRSYALRQYAPAAAGIALAFFLGWAIAVGGARKTAANPRDNVQPAAPAAASTTTVAPAASKKPSAARQKTIAANQKSSVTKPKAKVNRFRRPAEEQEVVWKNEDHGGDDVTVIHHYPGKSNLAHSGKKTSGVKTISDLEQD